MYDQMVDKTVAVITDAEGVPISDVYEGACYAGLLNSDAICYTRQRLNAKYLDVFFADSVSMSGSTDKTELFLSKMKDAGLFHTVEVSLMPYEQCGVDNYTLKRRKNTIRIRHDLDKCSAQEMFLVGLTIRMIAIYSTVVKDFLALCEKEPEIDVWKLWCIAHVMRLNGGEDTVNGHSLLGSNTTLLNKYTLKKFYKEHTGVCLRLANNYYLSDRLQYNDLFITKVDTPENLYEVAYGTHRKAQFGIYRKGGVAYSKEAIQTFLDKKKMLASLDSKSFCNIPYIFKELEV